MTQFTISLPPVLNRDAYEEIHEEQVIPEQSNESESASLADEPDSASSSDDVLVVSDTRSTRASGTRLRRNPRRSSTTMHSLNDSDSCPKRRPGRPPKAISVNSRDNSDSELSSRHTRRHRCFQRSDDESSSSSPPKRASKRRKVQNRTRARAQPTRRHSARLAEVEMQLTQEESGASFSDSGMTILTSDVLPKKKRNTKTSRNARAVFNHDASQKQGTRQSERSTRMQQNMREVDISQIYRSDSEGPRQPPKATGVREAFQVLPTGDPFRDRHCKQCDTCGNYGGGAQGQLIHCQGCTLSYHRGCIGHRTGREHLVTKIASNNFVFQCRRCISFPRRKESTGPEQGMCQTCREIGPACVPFRSCKTPAQEEKERDDNDGEDPIASVDPSLINNPDNVLFRCTSCWRGFHFHHLLPRSDMMDIGLDDDMLADERFREYAQDWICRDCSMMPAKVSALVAWRPVDPDAYREKISGQEVPEDDKEYLIKWEDKSYFRAQWMQGAWTWGVTAPAMRKAFAKRESCDLPIMRTEDAIPEDFLRIDIVLDVHFTSIVDTRGEEIDKARIKEVKEAFIKYKGLGYEDAVWETVPSSDDGERWIDFVRAYDDWVAGRYIRIPKSFSLKNRLDKARSTDFNALEKKKQPETLTGGELMKYQLDGLNWLCYRWYSQKNAVLADEMGLGKTIQIIGLFATLVSDYNCFPFLIVVPNSTCPNWRHEIKQWAPSLRVVTYFGSSAARSMAYRYELFPEGSKSLRCHIVVTSYEAAADTNCQKFFRSVPWQGLIVDEGQRLKNDRNQLYGTLSTLKIPFSVLLTGTPLQNNARELFNLLQFLDASFDAEALELEYAELTKENLPQLHALIRPFFLRRTKAEVLTFLPPMGQVIVPVAMTVLQKKLYMSILAKNPQLIKAIFNSQNLGKNERASLSNILMQLRKCLSHPFVYNKDIEERSSNPKIAHRNLVEASPKLHLLQLMLPKLKQRGHRVLIFSQFLDNLDIVEDFLDGLGYRYQRLDGSMGSLQKQKRIDEYNAPESPLFAFLLSTRAGGIGINLATADTVIILDPDFNPHQDIQALSRAHRIGQKKKVLCFQLMTIGSAEEKIVQIGRKKMALDHVLIEQMDADEDSGVDVESILRHGAAEILEDKTQDIRYDEDSVDKLLDRTQMEDTRAGEDHSAESQFSFARVWANDKGTMEDAMKEAEAEQRAPDPGVWDKILQERERAAAQEAARRQENLGRGKRARQTVGYALEVNANIHDTPSRLGREKQSENSDTDFLAEQESTEESSDEADAASDGDIVLPKVGQGPGQQGQPPSADGAKEVPQAPSQPQKKKARAFYRSNVVWPTDEFEVPPLGTPEQQQNSVVLCIACNSRHRQGFCPLKIAGPEFCGLCGLAHFGVARTCPHIRSETQVRTMIAALKESNEPKHLVSEALRYLQGVRGTLAQNKRIKAEKQAKAAEGSSGVHSVGLDGAKTKKQPVPAEDAAESQRTRLQAEGLRLGPRPPPTHVTPYGQPVFRHPQGYPPPQHYQSQYPPIPVQHFPTFQPPPVAMPQPGRGYPQQQQNGHQPW